MEKGGVYNLNKLNFKKGIQGFFKNRVGSIESILKIVLSIAAFLIFIFGIRFMYLKLTS